MLDWLQGKAISIGLSGRFPPVRRSDSDVNQRGKCYAFLHVDLTLAAIPSSNQCGCSLHACGLHSAFFFSGHREDLQSTPYLVVSQGTYLTSDPDLQFQKAKEEGEKSERAMQKLNCVAAD
jgi:hypothetical protein